MCKFKHLVTLAVAAGLLITSVNGLAETATSNFYMEANAGFGKVNESYTQAITNDNTGFAWNVNGGYQFNQNLALELGFNSYPNETFKSLTQIGHGKKNNAIDFAAKLMLPINSTNITLFGKLGLAGVNHTFDADPSWIEDNSGLSLGLFAGAGVSYAVNEHVSVSLQGNVIPGTHDLVWGNSMPTMYQGTVGLSYKF